MIELRGTALWAFALLLSASAHPVFAAPFCMGGAPLNLCKRCTTRIEHSTPRNTACGIQFKMSDYAQNADLVILGSSVVKQAKHGHVQIDRTTWTYTPTKEYAGPDTFLIEWDLLSHGKDVLVIYTDQHMTVTP